MRTIISRRNLLLGACTLFTSLVSCKTKSSDYSGRKLLLGDVNKFHPGSTSLEIERLWINHEVNLGEHYFSALSLVCPHQACLVTKGNEGFRCPCHGATFNHTGQRLSGPTPRGLDPLELRLSSKGELIVLPDRKVSRNWRLKVEASYF